MTPAKNKTVLLCAKADNILLGLGPGHYTLHLTTINHMENANEFPNIIDVGEVFKTDEVRMHYFSTI